MSSIYFCSLSDIGLSYSAMYERSSNDCGIGFLNCIKIWYHLRSARKMSCSKITWSTYFTVQDAFSAINFFASGVKTSLWLDINSSGVMASKTVNSFSRWRMLGSSWESLLRQPVPPASSRTFRWYASMLPYVQYFGSIRNFWAARKTSSCCTRSLCVRRRTRRSLNALKGPPEPPIASDSGLDNCSEIRCNALWCIPVMTLDDGDPCFLAASPGIRCMPGIEP
mmetsp:Transcript_77875/g.225206  ORF Transcript_77875/g.225206 Transcript_77875/m.225206 type:complete len:224 (+) Transcript_77875:141-812(+)